MKKIFLEIILFLVIISLPWWLGVVLAIGLLFYLKSFNELIIFGLIFDIYYSKLSPHFNLFDYKFTFLSVVLLFISLYLKKRLKFYEE